jgi:hypothetical protein
MSNLGYPAGSKRMRQTPLRVCVWRISTTTNATNGHDRIPIALGQTLIMCVTLMSDSKKASMQIKLAILMRVHESCNAHNNQTRPYIVPMFILTRWVLQHLLSFIITICSN